MIYRDRRNLIVNLVFNWSRKVYARWFIRLIYSWLLYWSPVTPEMTKIYLANGWYIISMRNFFPRKNKFEVLFLQQYTISCLLNTTLLASVCGDDTTASLKYSVTDIGRLHKNRKNTKPIEHFTSNCLSFVKWSCVSGCASRVIFCTPKKKRKNWYKVNI